MKLEKGITLIALIITIVVLLILAIITIGAVQESGIIGHAQDAASDYTIAGEKEQIQLALSEWQMQKYYSNSGYTFKSFMEEKLAGVATVSQNEDESLTVTMKDTGNAYTVTDNGEIIANVKGISLSASTLSIAPGATGTITATLTGGLTGSITYTSSDKNVATVSENGEVRGVAIGEATITAQCENYIAECKVTVREVSLLEQYILGTDLAGRSLFEDLCDEDWNFYADEELGIAAGDVTFVTSLVGDDGYSLIIYIKYEGDTYKFKTVIEVGVDENGDETYNYITNADYGVIKIDVEGERVGKTVKYDNKIWTILYDDSTNGLQMISNQSLLYNNSEFRLGYNDSSITDWSIVTGAEFDGTDGLSNFEKTVYSYNNAIDTLNTACKSIVTANDNITDVRCVGSNPISKNSETTTYYTSDNLAKWPINNAAYAAGIGNGRGKNTDLNYVSDFDRMVALGVNVDYGGAGEKGYWLASRFVEVDSGGVTFRMRDVNRDGYSESNRLWRVTESNADCDDNYRALRPVVSLSSNIQLVANSTGEADYTF